MAFHSTRSADYTDAIKQLVKPEYESKYGTQIEQNLNNILNQKQFEYDFNADPMWQNYKDTYTKLGNEAAMNAAASASSLTGGYGNSYAGTAASQANQQYLTKLNEQIPELYNAAMQKYQMEQDNMYKQFGALQSEENRLYGQHRDSVSDYYSDWGNLQNGFSTAQAHEEFQEQMEFQRQRAAAEDAHWDKQFNYSSSRDAVSDDQWNRNFAYQQQRDAVADSQWEKQYQLALDKAKKSGGSGGSGGRSKKSDDTTVDMGALTEDVAQKYLGNMSRLDDPQKYLDRIISSNHWGQTEYDYLVNMYNKYYA